MSPGGLGGELAHRLVIDVFATWIGVALLVAARRRTRCATRARTAVRTGRRRTYTGAER